MATPDSKRFKVSTSGDFQDEISHLNTAIAEITRKRQVLKDLDCFVLDNSIRESTVGQLRGHTLENKWKIYNEVKRCGMKHIIVAAFSHMTRVDDEFIRQLSERGEDFSTLYAFSEITDSINKDGVLHKKPIPVGLEKMKTFGLRNPIIEIDLVDPRVDWNGKFTIDDYCHLLRKRIKWAIKHLHHEPNVFINIRDFPFAMKENPERVFTLVKYLAGLPPKQRPLGVIFEEPLGQFMPEELGIYTSALRGVLDSTGWESCKVLVHVHEKWGLADTAALTCLSNGASGVWASICEEGAAVGHASSSITLMNLVRLGNKIVQERYNCTELRRAAAEITKVTTGKAPHPKQVLYGERALDMVFELGSMGQGGNGQFDVAAFFGEEPPRRMSTLASLEMIRDRMVELFGENPQFTIEMAEKMKKVMIEDLTNNRKEEYMSKVGLALLFDRSGGKITEDMRDIIGKMELKSAASEMLIEEVRAIWDQWDLRDKIRSDDRLQFDSFYNGFMAPYFGCFRCENARKAMQAIDMDCDGFVDWSEFKLYLKWALRQYPEINDVDELLSVTFSKGLLPAMQDEIIRKQRV